MKFCIKCGAELKDDAKFCSKCGTRCYYAAGSQKNNNHEMGNSEQVQNKDSHDQESDNIDIKQNNAIETEVSECIITESNPKQACSESGISKKKPLILFIIIAIAIIAVIVAVLAVLKQKKNQNDTVSNTVDETTAVELSVEEPTAKADSVDEPNIEKEIKETQSIIDDKTEEIKIDAIQDDFAGSWTTWNCEDVEIKKTENGYTISYENLYADPRNNTVYCDVKDGKLICDDGNSTLWIVDDYNQAINTPVKPGEVLLISAKEYPISESTEPPFLVWVRKEDVADNTVISDDELCKMAVNYYKSLYGGNVTAIVDSYNGDNALIHIFEDNAENIATMDWYTVSRITGVGTDMLGGTIDLYSSQANLNQQESNVQTEENYTGEYTSAIITGPYIDKGDYYQAKAHVWNGDLQEELPSEAYHDITIRISKDCDVEWLTYDSDIEEYISEYRSLDWWMSSGTACMANIQKDSTGIIVSFMDSNLF